jgi:hypothetical protein
MTVAVSSLMQAARLNACLTTLGSAALLHIYGGTRPAAGADSAAPLLVAVPLADPPGVITGDQLVLSPLDSGGVTVLATGDASWARAVDGAGLWLFDCDVSASGGGGDWQLAIENQPTGVPATRLFAGSVFSLGTVALT